MSTPKPRRTSAELATFHAEKARLHKRKEAEAAVRDDPRWAAITAAAKALEAIPDMAFRDEDEEDMSEATRKLDSVAQVAAMLREEADRIAGLEES